ncbi:MAG: M23 family metallopeptidase [Thiothrix sp.]|nr:M23 family metallopeptidase [Thiothrix sp.]
MVLRLSFNRISALVLLSIVGLGFVLPETPRIPVSGASRSDWNQQSFWYYPWGRSGTHKGIDIFAPEGTPVLAATTGLIISTGEDSLGGNYVFMLGAKWRFHYYAHLQEIDTQALRWVWGGSAIGKVGTTGNAKGKPPHLHYDIRTPYPQPWLYDAALPQAWNRLFFVDPNVFLVTGR